MLRAVNLPIAPELILRDPAAALHRLREQWQAEFGKGRGVERWIFGYASLIWRPEFDAAEHRSALLHGWHRALRMRSRVNRGTPQQPGLVFALLPGGACRGVVYRLRPEQAEAELYSELMQLDGDDGARRVVARYPAHGEELDDPGVLMDVDTPAELAALAALAQQPGAPTPANGR